MADFSRMSDAALWKRLVDERSEAAFRALMDRHGALVWGVCSRMLRGSDADDAFQMTFLALLEHGGGIQSPDFGPWLYRVAYRAALRVRASSVADERVAEADDVAEPAVNSDVFREIEEAERSQLIAEAIDSLPDRYREVIVLHYGRGMRRDEIAEQLNLTDQAVKSRLARGRGALRTRLLRRGVSLGLAGLFLESLVPDATASAPPVTATWELVRRSLGGEPVSLAKAQFSDLPEMEYGMNYLRGLKAKWAVGAAVVATALLLMFEAGRVSGSHGQAADGDTMAARSSMHPLVASRPVDLRPVTSEFPPIRLAAATGADTADLRANDARPVQEEQLSEISGLVELATTESPASPEFAGAPTRSHGLPDGKWSRETTIGKVEFEIKDERLHVEFEGAGDVAGLKASLRGEYATASDGTIFGIMHRVDVDLGALTDEADPSEQLLLLAMLNDLPFAMRVYSDPDSMMVKSMTVGIPTMLADDSDMSGLSVYSMFLCGIYKPDDQ